MQNPNVFEVLYLRYAKSGHIVHAYFSGKPNTALASGTILTAINLPQSAIQQDCRVTAAYARGEVEIVVNGTSATMYLITSAPAGAWLRFNFSYISASST